jgi:hypothetical protein
MLNAPRQDLHKGVREVDTITASVTGFSPEVISSRIAISMSRIHREGRTPARRENAPEPLLVLRPMPKARAPRQKRSRDYVREKSLRRTF